MFKENPKLRDLSSKNFFVLLSLSFQFALPFCYICLIMQLAGSAEGKSWACKHKYTVTYYCELDEITYNISCAEGRRLTSRMLYLWASLRKDY